MASQATPRAGFGRRSKLNPLLNKKPTDVKPKPRNAKAAATGEDKPTTVTKQLKKGGSRTVPSDKASRYYPAEDVAVPKKSRKAPKPAVLRSSITPGTVLILLAGRFRGKRVVFLRQLPSGLLLVTGPFKVNGVPLRRVNQAYVIATSTKLEIGNLSLDESVLDEKKYFKSEKSSGAKPEASFFTDPANKQKISESKVSNQKSVDKAILAAIKSQGPALRKYLSSTFGLSNGDRPHLMRF
ncbi:hypothetical protein IE81DRAFT_325789 [Ceraceosorus guamensis]|nr:hypothetical protein IE81DRAFT_325789 [Ceraceosorus guamensis]PWN40224.1 hypothetical protein IE81DRAFT_325789 [Ceraceosorus guamensis]